MLVTKKHWNWLIASALTILAASVLIYCVQVFKARAEAEFKFRAAVARIEAASGELGPRSILQHNYTPTPENVRQLSFRGESLTDQELLRLMDDLKQFPRLKSVDLSGTRVTDTCLDSLRQIPELRTLTLEDTVVTDAAVERFRQAIPRVNIYR